MKIPFLEDKSAFFQTRKCPFLLSKSPFFDKCAFFGWESALFFVNRRKIPSLDEKMPCSPHTNALFLDESALFLGENALFLDKNAFTVDEKVPFSFRNGEKCLFWARKCPFRRFQISPFLDKSAFFYEKLPFCFKNRWTMPF